MLSMFGRALIVLSLLLAGCRPRASDPPDASASPDTVARPDAAVPVVDAGGQHPDPDAVGLAPDSPPVSPDSGTRSDGSVPVADMGGQRTDPVALIPGSLQVSWMHGASPCAQSRDPELQVHAYNASTYIIRQDKCRTFEAPFVYLLLGERQALLLDTGATNTAGLHDIVKPMVGARTLLVAHSHAHGDHVASDARFIGEPGTTVVAKTRAAVQAAFGITSWPTDQGQLDLGGRVLDVIAIPGHEATHIAIYDRQTGLLLTGDTLYPGLLFISNWTEYRASVHRLVQFVATHPVAHVLGAHIEMTSTAKVSYPYGTTFQPAEHVLPLEASDLAELDAALTTLGPTPPPRPVVHDSFVIFPQP
jgi:glyoxylase-like metal-dependent hydrolase (beta-lactamase superfamily II)